jgi:hypothetical protein
MDDELYDELDALDEGEEKRDKAKNKSLNLDKLKALVWLVPSALIAFILVRTIMNPTFIFTNWYFMLIAVVVIVGCLLVYKPIKKSSEKVTEEIESAPCMSEEEQDAKAQEIIAKYEAKIGIPSDAKSIDILFSVYKPSSEGLVPQKNEFYFIHSEGKAFKQGDELRILFDEDLVAIKLDTIKKITKVDAVATFNTVDEDAEKFESNGFTLKKKGFASYDYEISYLYSMTIVEEDEEFVIYIPSYNLTAYEEITGQK